MGSKVVDRPVSASTGFTLVELLVVLAIIALLASLLFPVLSRAKAQGRSVACKNELRQVGLALGMYVSDCGRYPPLTDWDARQVWMDRLYTHYPVRWTNSSWQCPQYIANNGLAVFWATNTPAPWQGARLWSGYSYNNNGIIGNGWLGWTGTPVLSLRGKLGLGGLPVFITREPEVTAPSQMYVVADARSFRRGPGSGWFPIEQPYGALGLYAMTPWRNPWHWDGSLQSLREMDAPHGDGPGRGYNVLFGDGHVVLVKRQDYLFPRRTARNWNRDNRPHEEAWAPTGEWEVKQ